MTEQHPIQGFMYLLKGFSYLTKPGLKRFVIMPIIINIILFSLFFFIGFSLINHVTLLLPDWLHWLRWLFWIVFFFASTIIMVFTFTILANVIAAPFNSMLSEKVELISKGKKPTDNDSFKATMKDIPRSLKREWDKIKYYLPRMIILLILYFIPIINLIVSVLWFVFGCWMMSVEYLDYPFDNRKTPFSDLHQHLRKHCLTTLGFGFAVTVASMIPIVNFFVMPSAVIGGTLMFLDQQDI